MVYHILTAFQAEWETFEIMRMSRAKRSAAALLATAAAALGAPLPAWGQIDATKPDDTNEREKLGPAPSSEIVVTGRSLAIREVSSLPVGVLAGAELAHRRQGGIGETLAGLPGIHLDSFGGGASRPVIRGQTVPRIEILTDGAAIFDASSISPDHAITTDPLLLDAIEVQRGPAAVRYGGNAVNGAINLIDSKVPKTIPDGQLIGTTEVRYGAGDQEKTVVGRVTAGVGQIAIHAEGSRRAAEDYNVPNSYGTDKLRDSFATTTSYSVGGSWITSKGYIGAAYTRQDSHYGLPGHSHANGACHLHSIDLHCEGEFGDPFQGLDDAEAAYIDLQSDRVDVRADYDRLMPGLDHARLRLSYTDYNHSEFDGPLLFTSNSNKVYDGRLELTHAPVLGFSGTFGVQYTRGTFVGLDSNFVQLETDPHEFVTENAGIFLTERRSFGSLDVELAARTDWRRVHAVKKDFTYFYKEDPEFPFDSEFVDFANELYAQFYAEEYPRSNSRPFSASLGVTWNLPKSYSANLFLASTQRAPNVRELYAKGNNLATSSFEIGLARTGPYSRQLPLANPDILETNKSVDLTLRKSAGRTKFEIGLFYQDVRNYIFARLLEESTETEKPQRLLLYTAADSRFWGIDGQVSHQFAPSTRITLFGDYVNGDLRSHHDNLPRVSPGRLGTRYNYELGRLSAEFEYYHTFAQTNFASYETRTQAYDMFNATLAYRFDLGRAKSVELYLRGTNITNELALAHTSFVKNQSPLRGRSVAFGMRHTF
jgi:iron complex outermembrane receptor protein